MLFCLEISCCSLCVVCRVWLASSLLPLVGSWLVVDGLWLLFCF